ncbi:2-hydroxy-acid oxidase [Kitasatospora sp. NA04385]|uniref:2-hydroxy-acid oxidase n=1 Tax=Kitasatospora sp. NA04385 TaxID=2742135 RepID=UPI00159045CB|nr:2-hydroxy-acid oxidase [Kitasatospora sp. NA04385]QKW22942.1 2-hydroxy-acid oxidase [Kitasatospora sp. NA04385]
MRTFLPPGAAAAASPPDEARTDGPPPAWGIRRAVRLAFPGPGAPAGDPVHGARLRRYLTDLLHPYGLELAPGAPAPGAAEPGGRCYGEMAEALIRAAVPEGEAVDLLVLAHAVPDITPGRATTTWLSHVCPGTPMALAVSDQGAASAFTALRLVDAYARSGGLRRALLLVVEQDSLPYDPGVPVVVPAGSRGVALLFGDRLPRERTAAVSRVATRVLADGSPAAALAAELAGPGDAPARKAATGILGTTAAAAAAHPWPPGLRFADAGQPATGVWWDLAGELAEPSTGPRTVVLADYDAGPDHLSTATIVLDGGDADAGTVVLADYDAGPHHLSTATVVLDGGDADAGAEVGVPR